LYRASGLGLRAGSDVLGIQAAQFSLIPPFTTENPILITTFVVTGVGEGSLSYISETAAGVPFPFSITGPIDHGPAVDPPGQEVFVSQTLAVTPGAVGVLGVAGVVGLRRRRG
jgi:hypothetical protein